ncbi:LuxR C-terminal-related transcriptional regulator [Rhodococcus oxybenzonivorans]|uniref:ATP-binding protein n=1 Tax=Rhodococcus oxybenzonivorans TaxID=1990687 RepID=UPI002955512A|nr:LuxR C-terminal-related transcriptional regulator [Rhodococcus oxybenzonivorans]MDV7352165.1 LuxR C-terminal-related transcriptional regulator [Rhodococcus oxybenzonivorans]
MTSFVGRRGEVGEARRLLGSFRLVTVTGVGGVGKTRLAARIAADARRAFTDGVWFIELGGCYSGQPLAAAVAGALGLDVDLSDASFEDIVDFLCTRQVLLVLDGCEHRVGEVAVATARLLRRCPDLRILVTSRELLGIGGEATFTLQPFPVSNGQVSRSQKGVPDHDAVKLFTERACAVVPGFTLTASNKAVVTKICERLDGLPLAIEFAAARLRVMSAEQVLQNLSSRYRFLNIGSREEPPRQRSLQACIDWSYELCTPRERMAWRSLSVFAGGFELDAAEVMCGADLAADELLDVVTGLVNKSILLAEESDGLMRYRFIETLREYGLDRLRESGEYMMLKRRHRDWCARLALTADTDWISSRQAEWIHRLDRERPNLREAMTYCLSDPSESPLGLQMANSMSRFWTSRGLLREGRRWLSRARSCQLERSSTAIITALCAEAILAGMEGDTTSSAALVERACRDAVGFSDPAVDQVVTHAEGELALLNGNALLAAACFERALEATPTGNLDIRLRALLGLGHASRLRGDTARAIACYEEALAVTEAFGESVYRAHVLTALASEVWHDQPRRAEQMLNRGLRLSRRVGSPIAAAGCLERSAWIASAQRRTQHAAVLLGAAERLRQSAGHPARDLRNVHADHRKQLRCELGDRSLTAAVRRGHGLALSDAVAYALGEKAGSDESAKSGSNGDLTAREQQVAGLVAHGMTNREIAEKLVISPRTAQGHVEHILAKLRFTSRAQIAAWAIEQNTV